MTPYNRTSVAWVSGLLSVCAWVYGCSTHPSGTQMTDLFLRNEKDFAKLAQMISVDARSGVVGPKIVTLTVLHGTECDGSKLSSDRCEVYAELLEKLGLNGGFAWSEGAVLYVDSPSILNAGSRQGFIFRPSDVDPAPLVPNIEMSNFSKSERSDGRRGLVHYSRLRPHWFLFKSLD